MSNLFLGVGRKNITPEIGCQLLSCSSAAAVEDELTATAFYFLSGNTSALAISVTVSAIQNELSERIRSEIEKRFGIPKENCIISATHNRTCPNTVGNIGNSRIDTKYCNKIFIPQILSAVETAVNNITPVKVGVSVGTSFVGVNRREIMADNDVLLGQNPLGYFDPRMTVITFKNLINKDIAIMVHYGAHCSAAGDASVITRDWAGIMTDALEETSGAIAAFFNSAVGDVGPRLSNGKTTGDISFVKESGSQAAHDAVRIYRRTKEYTDADLSAATVKVSLPLKERISLEEARKQLEEYDEVIKVPSRKRSYLESVIDSYNSDFTESESREIEQTIIKFGDVMLVSSPFELFSEIGTRISKESNFPHVLSLSCSNGYEGYLATEDQLVRVGYEVRAFKYRNIQPYADNSDWHIIFKTVDNIKNFLKK